MAKNGNLDQKITDLQNTEGKLEAPAPILNTYNPSKRMRAIRRQVYSRFYLMRDNPFRTEAEAEWDMADKEYGMVLPEQEPDDWHSNLQLPDAFSAIQSQAQETIERKSRPTLNGTEQSDEPKSEFCNDVMNYNMNNTGYDYQYYLGKLSASIRGTSFLMDYWRTEKRTVKVPMSLNPDGTIKYKSQEIVDFDDDYTEYVPNEYIHIDEKAKHIDEAVDGFRREIINIDEFYRKYGDNPDFYDTEFVVAGGNTTTRSLFTLPHDIQFQDVEVLHYYNRAIDAYWVVANNVTIHDGPLPTKHKELPFIPLYQYRTPGKFFGTGIPKIVHILSEERKTIRNLNMDRQKLQINKMFIHNNAFDIDDEDLVSRPHGLISVDTNNLPLNQAIVPVEYGDVPASYFKTEEILLEDIRRAHGIDDRIEGAQAGGTATEAAILKESSLKRVNLISISNEMDSVVRIGRLKWSNIQFFYGVPRMENITESNSDRQKKVYRTISVQGRKYEITDNGSGGKQLKMSDVQGASAVELKPEFNKYLEGDFDIYVDSDVFQPISKAIDQTKKTEMFSLVMSNPLTASLLDLPNALSDVLKVNNVHPEIWLKAPAASTGDMMMLAESENMVMAAGQPLAGTPNATEEHTIVHLMFTKTAEFQTLKPEVKGIIMDHILQEHDANPNTTSAASLLGGSPPGNSPGGPLPPGAPPGAAGGPGAGQAAPLNPGAPQAPAQPQAQVADLQAANFSK